MQLHLVYTLNIECLFVILDRHQQRKFLAKQPLLPSPQDFEVACFRRRPLLGVHELESALRDQNGDFLQLVQGPGRWHHSPLKSGPLEAYEEEHGNEHVGPIVLRPFRPMYLIGFGKTIA